MKQRIITSVGLAILAGITLLTPAFGAVNINWAYVGDVGNAADTADGDSGTAGIQRYGAVGYAYKIAQNETTISQYCEFLNAAAKSDPYALYNPRMSSTGGYSFIAGINRSGSSGSYSYAAVAGSGNKPITFVSWFDAARFCNWLHNGQGNGDTETGAYTLNGATSGAILREAAAKVWIPSENEWYKAAYYDPTKGGSNYWLYPTQSDALAGNSAGVAHSANYFDGDYVGYPGAALTNVGAYGANSASHYGTNDQGGNVFEWNDAVRGPSRGLRGGSWVGEGLSLASSIRGGLTPSDENTYYGFRVASVPEPSGVILTILAGGVLVTRRKR
ncbi:MAG: SUMF1/EgtB/PvdO family nonheme iron enzyme [Verrucomicrobia bacterium]|nr:SUMF1/EgtB/PvdO family nonheme iron enzyme [Verrucomicrobiota bacterium]